MKTYVVKNTKTGLYAKLDENYNVCWDEFSTGGYGSWGSTNKSFLQQKIDELNIHDCVVVDATLLQKEFDTLKEEASDLIDEYMSKQLFGFALLRKLEGDYTKKHRIAAAIYRKQLLEFSELTLKEKGVRC